MTEPTRPVPGPPRPGPGSTGAPVAVAGAPAGRSTVPGAVEAASSTGATAPFAGLDDLPVAEHVAVFEAEHARLHRELGTIDQL